MTIRRIAGTMLFALALAPLGAQPDPTKEELKLKLPKPMFIGTPTNLRSPNLEAITGKPRPAFFVPKGTVLVSAKKKVTSSDMLPVIGELDMINDAEKSCGDGYFIELGPGPQWVQIDLGAPRILQTVHGWAMRERLAALVLMAFDGFDYPDEEPWLTCTTPGSASIRAKKSW